MNIEKEEKENWETLESPSQGLLSHRNNITTRFGKGNKSIAVQMI